MRKVLFLMGMYFLSSITVRAQTRMDLDTWSLKQDTYFMYFHIPDDTSVTFKEYKYQYKYKKVNKKSVDKVMNFDGCKVRVYADKDTLEFKNLSKNGPRCYKLIIWLEGVIYIIHVEDCTVSKVVKVRET